jgi:hypothetical protein
MKRLFFLFCLISFSFSAFAQGVKDTLENKEHKWGIGVFFTPNYSNIFESGNGLIRCDYNISVIYKINAHFQFITGAALNQFGYYIQQNNPIYPNNPPSYKRNYYYYKFIAIPVQCRYNFYTKPQCILYANIGFDLSYYLGEKDATYYSNSPSWAYPNTWTYGPYGRWAAGTSAIMPFAIASIGVENKIYKHLYSSISIGYEYSIAPLIYQTSNPANYSIYSYYHIYSCFFKIGVDYKF